MNFEKHKFDSDCDLLNIIRPGYFFQTVDYRQVKVFKERLSRIRVVVSINRLDDVFAPEVVKVVYKLSSFYWYSTVELSYRTERETKFMHKDDIINLIGWYDEKLLSRNR